MSWSKGELSPVAFSSHGLKMDLAEGRDVGTINRATSPTESVQFSWWNLYWLRLCEHWRCLKYLNYWAPCVYRNVRDQERSLIAEIKLEWYFLLESRYTTEKLILHIGDQAVTLPHFHPNMMTVNSSTLAHLQSCYLPSPWVWNPTWDEAVSDPQVLPALPGMLWWASAHKTPVVAFTLGCSVV